jgi:hypothetical protein
MQYTTKKSSKYYEAHEWWQQNGQTTTCLDLCKQRLDNVPGFFLVNFTNTGSWNSRHRPTNVAQLHNDNELMYIRVQTNTQTQH